MQEHTGYIVGGSKDFVTKVYGWMGTALAITAGTAYYISQSAGILQSISQPGVMIALILGQLGLVLFLSFMLEKMNMATTVLAFLLYSLLTGVTLSSIFLIYTTVSIVSTFIVAAGMFGVMSLYGYFTNEDLSSMANILMMALVGLIIGMVVNMFLRSPGFAYLLSGIGVIVFALLTAYDMQKIKQFGQNMLAHGQMAGKISIMGALMLYLDFVNLFLFLLNIMGKRKE